MNFEHLLTGVEQYYRQRVKIHGPTARGVDWNSAESQALRFAQLLRVCENTKPFSINDYGCGYGALVEYMSQHGYRSEYHGFDISEPMIAHGKALHQHLSHCRFSATEAALTAADYTVASGIFNVKLQAEATEWQAYMLHTLGKLAKLSEKGFGFNVLTSYSAPERRRDDLYYADPLFLFDYCKRNFSRFVTLLHDYPLYEFTILVRQ
jgi:SAM-dependent methyltransferase